MSNMTDEQLNEISTRCEAYSIEYGEGVSGEQLWNMGMSKCDAYYFAMAHKIIPNLISEVKQLRAELSKKKTKSQKKDATAFELFYKSYPKKISRGSAQKAWDKLNPDPALIETIMKALEAQKQSAAWLEQGGKFVPYPATWLNNQRWADEISFVQIKGKSKFDYEQRDYKPGELDKLFEVFGGEDDKK